MTNQSIKFLLQKSIFQTVEQIFGLILLEAILCEEKYLFEIVLLRLREFESRISVQVRMSNVIHFFRLA